jgi:hypothetical protein
MKLELESTTKIVRIVVGNAEVPARIWEGRTDTGIPVYAYITLVAVAEGQDMAQFDLELQLCRAPSPAIEAIPRRVIL